MQSEGKMEVVVAMSGGVDSSVAAALLLERGYSVRGMMLQLWNSDMHMELGEKNQQNAFDRAQQVADRLGISFDVIDAVEPFREKIVNYFIETHRAGLTPNPCFVCNRLIKWGLLMDAAIQRGADWLATGHYARVIRNPKGKVELHKGVDVNKDQSYILAGLTQDQLSHAILPLGEITKVETRKIAHRYNFINFDQPDSQDLCFLGEMNQESFLSMYAPDSLTSGEIRTLHGEKVGVHNGLSNYTIGQRKGLGSGFKEPLYVIQKDIETNSLIVGVKKDLGVVKIDVEDINWIAGEAPSNPLPCEIKIRYKSKPVNGVLRKNSEDQYSIVFDEKIRDATPGQYAVFYIGDQVIGSGTIKKTFREDV